jgi:hypothetical protein
MLTPRFENCIEVRMGCPFKSCELVLEGPWVPAFPERSWHDRWASDPAGHYYAFVAWDIVENAPAFRVWLIDTRKRTAVEGRRREGFCDKVEWEISGRFVCRIIQYIDLGSLG